MKPIYPNYGMIPAPQTDLEAVKWAGVKGKLDDLPASPFIPLTGLNSWAAISQMNKSVNGAYHYISDLTDHWQAPGETVSCHTGDCEDFAILKMATLKRAGFDYNNMAIMLGEIAALSGNRQHCYLIIELDGQQRVLDSLFDQLISPTEYINWQPKKVIINDVLYILSKFTTLNQPEV